jgi:hypothetical protein
MILSAPGFYKQLSGYQDTTFQVPITQPGEKLEAYMQTSTAYNLAAMGEVEVLPSAEIQINNTPQKDDNITLYNPSFSPFSGAFGPPLPLGYTQTIPVKIINLSSEEATFNVVVNPDGGGSGQLSGSGLLSEPFVTAPSSSLKVKVAAHGQAELTFTPTKDSLAANDVHIVAQYQYKSGRFAKVAEDDLTVVSVEFTPHIRNTDTPAAMKDRIAPGADQGGWVNPTSVYVQVTPSLADGQSVTLDAEGKSNADGLVSINQKTSGTLDLTSSQTVQLDGLTQTEPGHAGNIRLTVLVRRLDTVQSNGFSVSAIPVNFHQAQGGEFVQGTLYFTYTFDSDSGPLNDLSQVWVGSEATYSDGGKHVGPGKPWTANDLSIIYPTGTTPFDGPNGDSGSVVEYDHPPGRALPMAGPGDTLTATENFGFIDFRTASSNFQTPVNLLGPVEIDYYVFKDVLNNPGQWVYTIFSRDVPSRVVLGSGALARQHDPLAQLQPAPSAAVPRIKTAGAAHDVQPTIAPIQQPTNGTADAGQVSQTHSVSPQIATGPPLRAARSLADPLTSSDRLVVTTQPPASVTAGVGFGLVVTAETSAGNRDTTFSGTVHLGDYADTLGGNTSQRAVRGVATFSGLTLTKVASDASLIVSSPSLHSEFDTSTTLFRVTAAAASQLVDAPASLGPPPNVVVNGTFSHIFHAEDAYGNLASTFNGNVTVALASNPGNATLSGTLTVAAKNGVITFSNLMLDQRGNGYTLKVTSPGLHGGTTAAFDATDQLVFTSQPPASITAGDPFNVTVAAEDGTGAVDTSFNGDVSLGAALGPFNSGGITNNQATAVNGVASFSGVALTTAGAQEVTAGASLFSFSSGLTQLVGAVSNSVTVAAAPASQLMFNISWAATFPLNFAVDAEDPHGNIDPNFNGSVSVALTNNPGGANLGGTTTATASSGVAQFTGLTIDQAGTYTLQATSAGLTPATSESLYVNDSLVASTPPPSSVVAGQPFTMVISAEVPGGFVDTSFNGTVTIVPNNFSGGTISTFQGPLSAQVVNGVATLSGLSLTEAGSYGFVVNDGSIIPLVVPFNVVAAPASQLAVTTQPPSSVTAGDAFALTVSGLDAYGNVDTSFTGNVTLALADNPGGATLGGTLSVPAVKGVAGFTKVILDRTGNGYILQASGIGPTSVLTDAIQVGPPGAAADLVITKAPAATVTAGTGFGLVVKAEDAAGRLDHSFNGMVTVFVGGGANPGGKLSVKAVHGVARFAGLTVTQPGSHFVTATSNNLVQAAGTSFTVDPASASQLVVAGPDGDVRSGAYSVYSNPNVTVIAEDKYGNAVTNFSGSVTLSIANNPTGAKLHGSLKAAALGGVATFYYVTLDKPGTSYTLKASSAGLRIATSAPFDVTSDDLAVTTQPADPETAGAAFGFSVAATSANGTDTSFSGNVSVALVTLQGNNAVLGGTLTMAAAQGVANFSGLTLDQAGVYALTVTASGMPAVTTNSFAVNAAPASQLVVTTQPPGTITSQTGFALAVTAEDPDGNIDPSFNGSVTLAIANNPGGGNLGGTLTATAVNGVAVFSGVTIDQPGNGYTLQASSAGLTAATSAAIDVTPIGVASQLVVTGQPPASVAEGAGFGLVVQAQDGSGNVDATYSGSVTVALVNDYTGATLGGTLTAVADKGVATFAGLTLTQLGFYTLEATAAGLAAASTNTFVVAPAPASQLVAALPVGPVVSGSPFSLTIDAEDPQGNVDTTFNGKVTLAIAANPGSATLGGTLTATAVNGVASFSGLTLNKPGSGYTLQATSTGLTSWTSSPFDVTKGLLVVTAQPPSVLTVGAPFGLLAKVEDGLGHVLTSFQGSITIVLNSLCYNAATLGGSVTAKVTKGAASFRKLTVDQPGSYSLSLSGNGLTGADTSPFSVTGAKATQLAVTTQPPSTVTVGSGFEVDVAALDPHGNLDTNFNGSVTLALGTNPGNATFSGMLTATAVGGVASFPGLALDKPASGYTLTVSSTGLSGATTTAFNATVSGIAARLVVTTPPPATVSAGSSFGLAVTAEDSSGTVDTTFTGSVTLAVNDGATLGGTVTATAVAGVATFSGLTLTEAGDYVLSADSNPLVPGVTSTIGVQATAATQLAVGVPSAVLWNAPFAVNVLALDANGNVDPTYNGNITISLSNNPTSAGLGGTLTVAAQNGVACFTGLSVTNLGTGYTLQATSTGLSSATSSAFDVMSDQLVVTAPPPGAILTGSSFTLVVSAEDASGTVDTSFDGSVTVALNSFLGNSATLGGKLTVTAVKGVATFVGLTVNQPGSFSLSAISAGVIGVATGSFDVTGMAPKA